MKILCWLGFHRWRRVADQLGNYGMGMEWFECWECDRCPKTSDRVRGDRHSYQVHATRER